MLTLAPKSGYALAKKAPNCQSSAHFWHNISTRFSTNKFFYLQV